MNLYCFHYLCNQKQHANGIYIVFYWFFLIRVSTAADKWCQSIAVLKTQLSWVSTRYLSGKSTAHKSQCPGQTRARNFWYCTSPCKDGWVSSTAYPLKNIFLKKKLKNKNQEVQQESVARLAEMKGLPHSYPLSSQSHKQAVLWWSCKKQEQQEEIPRAAQGLLLISSLCPIVGREDLPFHSY